MSSKKKSLIKSITWRITATLTTLILVFIMSGELETAGKVAFFELFIKMAMYYYHERAWEKVKITENVEYTI
ncbi:MAG: DUF2061 domain-containing protein [Acidaminobacteraceae bacterium]